MTTAIKATGLKAEVLSPFYYHSLAVQSGTATLPEAIGDRAMAFALTAAMGGLNASPALPKRDYANHLARLPWLASVFLTDEPRLLRPLHKRLNLDAEAPWDKAVQDATGTGNLKTFFSVQEIPNGAIYHGAVFGPDPFELAKTAGHSDAEIVVRVGRHLGGVVRLTRCDVEEVRLNAHTAITLGANTSNLRVDRHAMYDLQITEGYSLDEAARHIADWQSAKKIAA